MHNSEYRIANMMLYHKSKSSYRRKSYASIEDKRRGVDPGCLSNLMSIRRVGPVRGVLSRTVPRKKNDLKLRIPRLRRKAPKKEFMVLKPNIRRDRVPQHENSFLLMKSNTKNGKKSRLESSQRNNFLLDLDERKKRMVSYQKNNFFQIRKLKKSRVGNKKRRKPKRKVNTKKKEKELPKIICIVDND